MCKEILESKGPVIEPWGTPRVNLVLEGLWFPIGTQIDTSSLCLVVPGI